MIIQFAGRSNNNHTQAKSWTWRRVFCLLCSLNALNSHNPSKLLCCASAADGPAATGMGGYPGIAAAWCRTHRSSRLHETGDQTLKKGPFLSTKRRISCIFVYILGTLEACCVLQTILKRSLGLSFVCSLCTLHLQKLVFKQNKQQHQHLDSRLRITLLFMDKLWLQYPAYGKFPLLHSSHLYLELYNHIYI